MLKEDEAGIKVMMAHVNLFLETVDSVAKETAVGQPAPALQRGDGGIAGC